MWLPSDEPEITMYGNKFEHSYLPSIGYIRILNEDYESILFLNDGLIVGAWYLDAGTLNELYENMQWSWLKFSLNQRLKFLKPIINYLKPLWSLMKNVNYHYL